MSADGRFVAFEGRDGNLVPNDNNHDYDVFVRDLTTNAIVLISAHDATLPSTSPNGPSAISALSASMNGRIAFISEADNLVANDTNGFRDVFVRDMIICTNILVSVATNGVSGRGASTDPAISADGRYVAFDSSATNLVANDNNNAQDVFVRDLQAGKTALVSVSSDGKHPGSGASYSPIISANGRYILFHSTAYNLILGFASASEQLYWRDMQSGMTSMQSVRTNVVTYPTGVGPYIASMTPDGRYVAFASSSLFRVWDSQSTNLYGYIYSSNTSGIKCVAISPDGRRGAYQSTQLYAVDLVANTNWVINAQASTSSHATLQFSGDGRFLAYVGLVNNTNQIYLYDFQAGTNFLVSTSFNSTDAANGPSDSPAISVDGRFVAYRSMATNILSGVTNGVPNIFLYDQLTGATTLMSVSRFGNWAPDNRSLRPIFSGDGQTLFFQSWASDIVANDFNHSGDIFSFKLYSTAWIVSSAISGQPLKIIWVVAPGNSYRVQYKDNLTDPVWLDLNGTTTLVSDGEYVTDLAPNPDQRFYRIISSN
jgi:Tol biopolymer transport system component